ncbi:MAG: DNA damage-inducible protein D [Bacteroides sp.]|nr:DNA damage-inducible protein D [Bacillota bacterium]MCM1394003.1 DNA damage-inducible protein D [[Eubacterium] siraeum]MCM1456147.1 DNA damage-inducible protein D [Bacteroides sp.]
MKNEITREYQLFEDIKQVDADGNEFWLARELQEVLGYAKWENFHKVIQTAQIACKISHQSVEDCFPEVRKSIISGKGRKSDIIDYKLTRYACYLIVMNGDPRKDVIALGQTYFAVKTRQQELNELYDRLSEDEKRLFIRGDVKQKNMLLAEAAHNAGIITQREYAIFQDSGYRGLYGGLTARDIADNKGLSEGEEILDYMGSEELAANLFRITQTEAKMKRENVSTPMDANRTHYEVGTIVRKAIQEAGGTMPENLPTPDKSISEIEKQIRPSLQNPKE